MTANLTGIGMKKNKKKMMNKVEFMDGFGPIFRPFISGYM